MKVEENAIVLDFLPRGRSSDYKTEPLAQLLGTEFFTLLEVVTRAGVELKALDEVYVGKDDRPAIDYIKRRISFKELTSNSMPELPKAIEKVILANEKRFVEFYNLSRSITIKRHQLELLPGMGKKHMLQLLAEREKKPFESFVDIRARVPGVHDPIKAISGRILDELEREDAKHYIFVRPPSREKEFRPRRFSR